MSELRLNLITREWVIIATDRAKRSADFMKSTDRRLSPPYLASCPFCLGNEDHTPIEHFRISTDGAWKLRVVSNKYPAVSTEGEKYRSVDGTKRFVSGVGLHEVIVESQLHNTTMALRELPDIVEIVGVYRDRFVEAYIDSRVEHVIIFKNHGVGAGTSIDHSHTQLVAIPIVPLQYRDRVLAAMHYFDDTGECLICDTVKMETEDGSRIVIDTENFVTFVPYAALSPFHIWIFPKRHCASFSGITDEEIKDIAFHLKSLLSKFYTGLEDPDYNMVIRSSRPKDIGNEYSHWYMSIIPRLSHVAGFELGSGMYVNSSLPEESAAFLRAASEK
jgi:UDPglucose--hexose-1-phosphate uridylyltransferase